jgi:hypothetical protein
MITLLLFFAVICFLLAVLSAIVPRLGAVPWVALGLLFWVLTVFLPRVMTIS